MIMTPTPITGFAFCELFQSRKKIMNDLNSFHIPHADGHGTRQQKETADLSPRSGLHH